jgi:hypothetical protein
MAGAGRAERRIRRPLDDLGAGHRPRPDRRTQHDDEHTTTGRRNRAQPSAPPRRGGRAATCGHHRRRRRRNGRSGRACTAPAGRSSPWLPATRRARERFRSLVPTARGFAEATPVLDEAELIILAVPDDAIHGLAGELGCTAARHWSTPRACWARRCSSRRAPPGPESALPSARSPSRHGRGRSGAAGATVAIEAKNQLAALLAEMARRSGATGSGWPRAARPLPRRRGARAGGFVAAASTRSPSWAPPRASTKRARWRSTAGSSSRPGQRPGAGDPGAS